MADNYLLLENLLVERIKSEVTGWVVVEPKASLAEVEQERQLTPSIYIIYLGDEITTGTGQHGGLRKVQVVTQQWAMVVTSNPADASTTGSYAREELGELLGKVITAITGWKPLDDIEAFRRSAGRTETIPINGFIYYPLIFETSFIFPKVKNVWTSQRK